MKIKAEIYNHDAKYTTDNRSRKEYNRRGNLTIKVPLDDIEINMDRLRYPDSGKRYFGNDFAAPTPDSAVAHRLRTLVNRGLFFPNLIDNLEEGSIMVQARYIREGRDEDQEDRYISVAINWVASADKPSLIPDEVNVLSMVNPVTVMTEVKALVSQAIEWINYRNDKITFLEGVESLSGSIVSETSFNAIEVARYNIKLAALQAEFNAKLGALKAEIVACTVAEGIDLWKELNSDGNDDLPDWCLGDVADASERYWTRFIKPPSGGEFGRGFPSSHQREPTPLVLSELGIEPSEV
jgi:hypothetical protein